MWPSVVNVDIGQCILDKFINAFGPQNFNFLDSCFAPPVLHLLPSAPLVLLIFFHLLLSKQPISAPSASSSSFIFFHMLSLIKPKKGILGLIEKENKGEIQIIKGIWEGERPWAPSFPALLRELWASNRPLWENELLARCKQAREPSIVHALT